jgi:hypothetical protein
MDLPREKNPPVRSRQRIAVILMGCAFTLWLSCYNPFFPPMGLPLSNNGATLRSTPQGVIQQLNNAYNNLDIDLYKDLFSQQQDFRFYIAPAFDSCTHVVSCEIVDSTCHEILSKEGLTCLKYWTYTQEMESHTSMFAKAEAISLNISPLNNQDIRAITSGNGETTGVEIIVRGGSLNITENIMDESGDYYQNVDELGDIKEQVFYLERDPQNSALWVIKKWFDLGQ